MNNAEVKNHPELESYKVCLSFLVIFSVAAIMFSGFLIALFYAFFM